MPMEKTFDAQSCETAIYAAWEAVGAFEAGANASRDETFCVMIPPPNVTGSLHMGHAFNNTLQDILVRWHRMRGFDTLWQPGQDHAGIATQMVVERQLAESDSNATRREMGREAFLEKVWAWKEKSGGTIIGQLKRLGASCDWSRNAFTMDETFQRAVLQTFVDLYHKGLIYRGKRLVNWDPHFETAISDLEVENIEVDGNMWHFKYPLAGGETYEYVEKDEDGTVTLRETRDYISIATTRPETMLGDGAVAVHPKDERYTPIVGKLCEIPVGPKEHRRLIPIITDDYPDPDFGSGAVKITGAHDFNDYGVAKRGNIPCYRLMDTKGAMRDDGAAYAQEAEKAGEIRSGAEMSEAEIDAINLVPEAYRGLDRFEARKAVVADITAEGLAVMTQDDEGVEIPFVERKKIVQPFGDRSKTVIEPMLTDQWFVKADVLAKPALEAVRDGRTTILPKQDEKVYFQWLENIEPWCISRQLWWGHQIPVWYDEDGNQYCAMSEAEAQAQAGDKVLTRDEDVLDTWFSSGLWPIGTLGWPDNTSELQKYFPTNVLVTGFDIIFFWVARMMMMQLEMKGDVPFSTVYVHALVRDEKGKKMSKSLGNVLDPLDLIDQYGADAVRFTLTAMAAMGRDLKLSTDRIAGYRNFGTKLWNAARFAEMNDCFGQYDPRMTHVGLAYDQITAPANRWIIGETARVRETIDAALDAYRFNDAAAAAYSHVWNKYCDWYVEFAKPLLADEATKAETQQVMAWALDQCLILLHPMMPFITEQLWGEVATRDKMLVHGDWPSYTAADLADEEADGELNWVIGLIESIRSIRTELRVPAGAKIPLIQLELDSAGEGALSRNRPLIERLARVPEVEVAEAAPKGAVTLPVKGGVFCLPLAEHIDVAAETSRLDKAAGKLEKELNGLQAKLGNEKFLAGAPADVVADQRQRLSDAQDEMEKLDAAKARLATLA